MIFRTTAPARVAMPRNPFSTKTMAPRDSFSVKSALQDSPRRKVASPQSNCAVRTVGTLWFPRKAASTSSSTNASILNALTTSTTSKRWTGMTPKRIMARMNTSSTTSAVNSRWIFSAWT